MRYFAGIDLGGTSAKLGLVDGEGNILKQATVRINAQAQFVEIMAPIARRLKELNQTAGGGLTAIGIGTPGFIDSRSGLLLGGAENIPALKGNSLVSFLSDEFKVPVSADNDATCAAAGELKFGIGRNYANFVLITLGTGIGGGLVLNGRVFRGSRGFAGEIGHLCLDPDGLWCNCGSRGCFEQYASAPAMIRNYREKRQKRGQVTANNFNAPELFKAARQGDPCAETVIQDAACAIARVLGILINLLNIEACIIGGGVSRAGGQLLNPVINYLDDFTWPLMRKDVALHIAQLQNDAGLLGAAAQALERVSP
ncbi:Glucokinase [subsurface metagenome]